MKFPLSWLKDYIEIDLPPTQIARILTLAGIEVDSIEKSKLGFDKVVVAQVTKVSPHPNADKLCIAEVFDGNSNIQVVCGAPNCREGIRSALATIGATLQQPNGEQFKVKKSKIRSVESFGMLCSGAELGISDDADGILEFSDHLQLGADVAEIYSDTIFEISLTPNLSHAASLIGIARELAAATGAQMKPPLVFVKESASAAKDVVQLAVNDQERCPLYACRVVQGLKAVESPDWLKKRLTACGIRPVHLAVDVTNYILMERGQPLHAFDLDSLENAQIVVRKAHENEEIQTLDEKQRKLSKEMLVIADSRNASAIAGVMGGLKSEVKPETKRFVFESAYFKPQSIRRTAKNLGLVTDSSRHFERGVDPNGIFEALDRAAMLMQVWGEAEVLQGVVSQQACQFSTSSLNCRLAKVNSLLGVQLSIGEMESMLQRLGFETKPNKEDALTVVIPSFRVDVRSEVDLIEEIGRMIGYDNIPRRNVEHSSSSISHHPLFLFERNARARLVGEGLQEFLTCDLIGPRLLEIAPDPKMHDEAFIRVLNPTSVEQSILRTSLLQGLLQAVKFNHDHGNNNVSAFEIGKVHFKPVNIGVSPPQDAKEEQKDIQPGADISDTGIEQVDAVVIGKHVSFAVGENYREPTVIGIILTGSSRPNHLEPKPHSVDFFDLKGIIENLLESLNVKRYGFRFSHINTFHSGRQALIQVDGVDIGSLGEIHPEIQRRLDVPKRIYFAEINLTDLLKAKKGDLKMRPISEYPSSERDWTVTVKEGVPIQQLIGSIQHIPSQLLDPEDVSLVDVYRSEKIGSHVKNVTLHFIYRDKEKTVSQEEVDAEHNRIISTAEKMLGTALH